MLGPSPRMRGGVREVVALRVEERSIPAYAGRRHLRRTTRAFRGVYPRVYGEEGQLYINHYRAERLSPRLWGGLRRSRKANLDPGSIPAHGGGAARAARPVHQVWSIPAYVGRRSALRRCRGCPSGLSPRIWGEQSFRPRPCRVTGLSPRVRGGHQIGGAAIAGHGSIPARCGGSSRLGSTPAASAPLADARRFSHLRRYSASFAVVCPSPSTWFSLSGMTAPGLSPPSIISSQVMLHGVARTYCNAQR